MLQFDFSSLNSTDLEELACDLLNAQEKERLSDIRFRTFKDGKDQGIDLLYSIPEQDYEIIGQVKHYFRSGYKLLLSTLKKDELYKINKLNPNRYILITSVDLTSANVTEIKRTLAPFIKNTSDIYGKKDLNRLLQTYSYLLNRHFKLWYSSTEIIKKITHYEIYGRSNEFKENELKRRLRLYVETEALDKARNTLERNNFVIITGEPGVGKTVTAELLVYEYIKKDYDLVYIYENIKEVDKMLDTNVESFQVFYFDDFLGHNAIEIEKARGSETYLLKVLRRISHLPNKKLIFTTRTFILNSTIHESENLRRFNIKTKTSVVNIEIYTKDIRSKLLNNHIEESDLTNELKAILYSKDINNYILNHPNFSPRSIEFITNKEHCIDLSKTQFKYFVTRNFDYPDEIWRHAYEQQISDIDRYLLNTLFSFGYSADYEDLEAAFLERLNYEVEYNNFQKPFNAFKTAFRTLENGFIVQDKHDLNEFKFINPSLVDFLLNHLRENIDEVNRIAESALFLEQLTLRLFPINRNDTKDRMTDRLKDKLLNGEKHFIKPATSNFDRLILVLMLFRYFPIDLVTSRITRLLNNIDEWNFLREDYELRTELFNLLTESNTDFLRSYFKIHGDHLFAILILSETNISKILELIQFAEKIIGFDWKALFLQDKISYDFSRHLSSVLNDQIEQDIEDLLGYSNAQNFVTDMENRIVSTVQTLSELGLKIRVNLSEYNKYDWWSIGSQNYFDEQMSKDD